MRKHVIQSVLFGAGILGLATTAQAAPAQSSSLTANAGVTTNYVFRGETQTDEGPAIQGGIDFNHSSGFYAGAWGSNVDFPPLGSGLEYDLYLGMNFAVSQDLKFDVGYITYNYTDSRVDDAVGANEIFVGGKYRSFALYYYNGNANNNNDYNYIDLRYTLGLPKEINLTLHYGHRDPDFGHSADDASVRVSKDISGFNTSLTFTTIDSNSPSDKDRLVLTVTKEFDLM